MATLQDTLDVAAHARPSSATFVASLSSIATVALLAVPAFASTFQASYHLSGADLGLLTAVFAVPYVLVQVPAGIIASVVGSRTVVVAGLCLLAASSLATAASTGVLTLIVVRAVSGLAAGVLFPIASALARVADIDANRRRQAALGTGWGVGYVLGLLALPLVFSGWRMAFVAIALWALLLAVRATLTIVGPPTRLLTARESFASLCSRTTLSLGTYLFGLTVVNAGVGAWVLIYVERELRVSRGGASLLASLIGFGLIPSALVGAKAAKRLGEGTILIFNVVLLSLALIALALASTTAIAGAALFGIGWGSGFSLGVALAWFATLRPGLPAQAQAGLVAAVNVMMFGAQVVAPPLVGLVRDATGQLRPALLALLCGPAIALAGLAWTVQQIRKGN